ncbi:hypothetical protein AA0X95_20250 [Bacillus sp. 1P10SD]|uniref:hypothetical protein n=1 Tax=Bacillus sp. 1P10SD TaxID=3132265 RepID=UPI0039A6B389
MPKWKFRSGFKYVTAVELDDHSHHIMILQIEKIGFSNGFQSYSKGKEPYNLEITTSISNFLELLSIVESR